MHIYMHNMQNMQWKSICKICQIICETICKICKLICKKCTICKKICKICKQYAGFDDITLYCMQYAKYVKQNVHDMQKM